jgi:hypothetical protein
MAARRSGRQAPNRAKNVFQPLFHRRIRRGGDDMKKTAMLVFSLLLALPAAQALAEATVTEAKLGKAVVDRNIANETAEFAVGEKAFLWVKVEGAADQTLTVTWAQGDNKYPVELKIGGSPWRTWASKTLQSAGSWSVTVSDSAGKVLKEMTLTVK